LYGHIPILTNVDHVKNDRAFFDELNDALPVWQDVHLDSFDLCVLAAYMLFDQTLFCRGRFRQANIAKLEQNLPVHIGDIYHVFVDQDYFLDTETGQAHRDTGAQSSDTQD